MARFSAGIQPRQEVLAGSGLITRILRHSVARQDRRSARRLQRQVAVAYLVEAIPQLRVREDLADLGVRRISRVGSEAIRVEVSQLVLYSRRQTGHKLLTYS